MRLGPQWSLVRQSHIATTAIPWSGRPCPRETGLMMIRRGVGSVGGARYAGERAGRDARSTGLPRRTPVNYFTATAGASKAGTGSDATAALYRSQ